MEWKCYAGDEIPLLLTESIAEGEHPLGKIHVKRSLPGNSICVHLETEDGQEFLYTIGIQAITNDLLEKLEDEKTEKTSQTSQTS